MWLPHLAELLRFWMSVIDMFEKELPISPSLSSVTVDAVDGREQQRCGALDRIVIGSEEEPLASALTTPLSCWRSTNVRARSSERIVRRRFPVTNFHAVLRSCLKQKSMATTALRQRRLV